VIDDAQLLALLLLRVELLRQRSARDDVNEPGGLRCAHAAVERSTAVAVGAVAARAANLREQIADQPGIPVVCEQVVHADAGRDVRQLDDQVQRRPASARRSTALAARRRGGLLGQLRHRRLLAARCAWWEAASVLAGWTARTVGGNCVHLLS
jgi:hypothetical protein